MRSRENLDIYLSTISLLLRFWRVDACSGYPPISFRISTVSQVFLRFLYAIPCTAATASSCRPRESKNLGDSYRWKRKKRHRNITKVMAPSVMTRYLQPMLSSFLHGPSSEQVKFGMKAQARRLDTKLPTGHHTLSMVRRFPEANGRNSRKRAPSTGKLPPTPRPKQAYSAQVLQLPLTDWEQHRYRSTYQNLPNPIRATTRGKTKSTADHECEIECRATADDIRGNAPE